jgi:hypothetical protein
MPLAFPSHQGLLAPLWRRWPGRFAVLALWVGALVPDVVDGTENVAVRGRFEQWLGHSLLGATLVGVPVGLALTAALRRVARRLARVRARGRVSATLQRAAAFALAVDADGRPPRPAARVAADALAVWIGALSHLFFDLLSHERSRLFWPIADDPAWFGAWWRTAWFRVSAPGYPGYPIGPHFVSWLLLSVLGAVMFFRRPPRAGDRAPT